MDQSRYSVLCSDFAARDADRLKWRDDAHRFVQAFRSAFASYLGCPEHFEVDGHRKPVVSLARLTDEGEVIPPSALVVAGAVAIPTDDAQWLFALRIYLSLDDGHHQGVTCQCRFAIENKTIRLCVADQEKIFTLDLANPTSFDPALDALYSHFREYFRWRPSAGVRKQRMGFAIRDDD